MEMQEEPVPMDRAQKHYESYKKSHDQKQCEIFFQEHAEDPWFREKYDPELVYRF
jgi:hypothetical protein